MVAALHGGRPQGADSPYLRAILTAMCDILVVQEGSGMLQHAPQALHLPQRGRLEIASGD